MVALGLISLAPARAWAGPPASASDDPGAIDGLVPPELIEPVELVYPPSVAREDDPPGGVVRVRFVVGADGVPRAIEVVASVDRRLDLLAVEAVAALRYRPGTFEGEPVSVALAIEIPFTPPQPEPALEEASRPHETETETETDPELEAAAVAFIEGVVLQAGDRTPVAEATVMAIPAGALEPGPVSRGQLRRESEQPSPPPAWEVRATTGADGEFSLPGLPEAGRVRVVVVTAGYERLDYVLEIGEGETLATKLYQERATDNVYRTTVRSDRDRVVEVYSRSGTPEELATLPGTFGDGVRALQNFPGMARAPFGLGFLIIRGAAPGDSATFLGEHEIPDLFHFGGITATFNSDLLTSFEYFPGNFEAKYGDAIGGAVVLSPRAGRRDGHHGQVDVDLIDAGLRVEGPLGEGSYALSARRSYIDGILTAVLSRDGGAFLAPRYWDYQALFDYPLPVGELSLRVFGSDDQLVAAGNDVGTDFELHQGYHRTDLVWRARTGRTAWRIVPSYRYQFGRSPNVDEDVHAFSLRAEADVDAADFLTVRIGTDTQAGWWVAERSAPGGGDGGPGGPDEVATISRTEQAFTTPALYTSFVFDIRGRAEIAPSFRASYYALPMNKVGLDPRLNASVKITDTTTIQAGTGMFSQAPSRLELDPVFGNPDLRPEYALQNSLTVVQKLPWSLSLEVAGFYNRSWDLAMPSDGTIERDGETVAENFANTGTGQAYGGELLLRRDSGSGLYGWIAYTLMRAEIVERPGEAPRLADFDQTHNLTIVAGWRFRRGWRVGARFRLTSGNPTTELTDGVFDNATGVYLPLQPEGNNGRLPMFHQLDLRVDKTWALKRLQMQLYLDIQNVYNARNPEVIISSFDYRETDTIDSLPILPSLGFQVEW